MAWTIHGQLKLAHDATMCVARSLLSHTGLSTDQTACTPWAVSSERSMCMSLGLGGMSSRAGTEVRGRMPFSPPCVVSSYKPSGRKICAMALRVRPQPAIDACMLRHGKKVSWRLCCSHNTASSAAELTEDLRNGTKSQTSACDRCMHAATWQQFSWRLCCSHNTASSAAELTQQQALPQRD